MNEATFYETLAKEVLLSDNPRLKEILSWCTNINDRIGACKDHSDKRPAHSAIVASMIIMEAGFVEETRNETSPKMGSTPFNQKDIDLIQYSFKADFDKRTITISACVTDFLGNVNKKYTFSALVLPMRTLHGEEQSESDIVMEPTSNIILP